MDYNEAIEILIQKQHEIEEYSATDLAIEALEKQIPAKLIDKLEWYYSHYLCPICNRVYWEDEIVPNYCQGCGQRFIEGYGNPMVNGKLPFMIEENKVEKGINIKIISEDNFNDMYVEVEEIK